VGHRSNVFVVTGGRTSLRREKWGAFGLPGSLLTGSGAWLPAEAGDDEPYDEEPYDEAWAEGGVLLDTDRRYLAFYTDINLVNSSEGLRRALLPLLAEGWPGWRVEYARRGLAELLAHAGLDRPDLLSGPRPVTPLTPDGLREALRVITRMLGFEVELEEYLRDVEPFTPLTNFQGYAASVVTVRDGAGRVTDHVGGMSVAGALAMGPELVALLAESEPVAPPVENVASEGAFIDVPSRTVALWQRPVFRFDVAELAEHWPGWRLTEHHDGLPGQLRLSGRDGDLVRMPWQAVLAEACVSLVDVDSRDDYEALLLHGAAWEGRRGVPAEVADVLRRLASPASGG
jgi:hypothetical protein